MMSTDYPFVKAEKGIAGTFLQEANLTDEDRFCELGSALR